MDRPRILVVDDEAGIREGLELLLEREGYDVRTAGDAWDAVCSIKCGPIDCLLVDMHLTRDSDPEMDGLDIITLLRLHQPEARAILISASSDLTLTRLAQDRGAVARLEKPLDLGNLTRLLRTLFPNDGPAVAHPSALYPTS